MRAAFLVAFVLAAPALSGCLDALLPQATPPVVQGSSWSIELPVTMNIVLVGFDGRIDKAALLKGLPETRPVFNLAEASTTMSLNMEPIQYKLDWRVHDASAAFETAFFDAAKRNSFEGPAPAFLVNYDRESGQNRLQQGPLASTPLGATPLGGLLAPSDQSMLYIDAVKLETWLLENRDRFGLAFAEPEYTVFLVDSYTKAGLPTDNYHYYYFDDGTIDADLSQPRPTVPITRWDRIDEFHTPKDPTSNRGWGGSNDFVWIDVGAAPSWLDYEPWVPAFEDDNVDHPIWDLEGQDEKLVRNLNRHVGDFALVKILRTPIYDFEYRPKWSFPVHVFVESTGISNQKDLPMYGVDVETWLIPERIEKAFEELAPWVDTTVTVEYHYLPMDDPGMAAAVRHAEAYGNPGIASSGVIEDYVRSNWDKYVPAEDEDTRVLPQFFFYFDGIYTFWGPNQGGGYAGGDGWGRPWAAFDHVFDVCANPGGLGPGSCVGTKASKWQGEGTMDMLVIHEGGHHVGLTHARDTSVLDEDGYPQYYANWLWDSVLSVMTYRHQMPSFDQYDKDVVARGHVSWTLDLAARRIAELRAFGASGDAVAAAEAGILRSEGLLRAGDWPAAAREAIATWTNLKSSAGGLAEVAEKTRVESFGQTSIVPASPGLGGGFGPAQPPGGLAFPDNTPLNVYLMSIEVKPGAKYVHLAIRDTQPMTGTLRAAYLVLLSPEQEFAGFAGGDIFGESYITSLRGEGTYIVVLATSGGLASAYDLTIDVHYPAS